MLEPDGRAAQIRDGTPHVAPSLNRRESAQDSFATDAPTGKAAQPKQQGQWLLVAIVVIATIIVSNFVALGTIEQLLPQLMALIFGGSVVIVLVKLAVREFNLRPFRTITPGEKPQASQTVSGGDS